MGLDESLDATLIHDSALIADLHAHPSLKISLLGRFLRRFLPISKRFNPLSMRTSWGRLHEGNVGLLLSSVYAPEREIADECRPIHLLRWLMPRRWHHLYQGNYLPVTLRMLDEVETAAQRSQQDGQSPVKVIHTPAELPSAASGSQDVPLLVHCIEGAHSLDGNPDNAQVLAQRGVAYITLAHFYDHGIAPPCNPWEENVRRGGCFGWYRDPSAGLTSAGADVIKAIADAGIIVDVVHSTPVARRQIYDLVGSKMLIASHVGAYGINPTPYNLADWELKRIADTGGVIGVIFMNYWLMPREKGLGIDAISHTIRHMVNVAGIDHVGIGTDFDGFTDPPDDLDHAGQLPRLTDRLVADGYTTGQIEKLLGKNVLRALREGWTA